MEVIKEILDKKKKVIDIYCKACEKNHRISVDLEHFEKATFPFSYIQVHERGKLVTLAFFDKNKRIIAIEHPADINLSKTDVSNIVEKKKDYILKKIPTSHIYAFKLQRDHEILKIYYKKNYQHLLNIDKIYPIRKVSPFYVKTNEICTEYYMRFKTFWVGGIELINYSFFIVVSDTIDINHLKSQTTQIFEKFSKTY